MSLKFEFHKAKQWYEKNYTDPSHFTSINKEDILVWNLQPENWQKWEKGAAKNFLVMKRCKKISKMSQVSHTYSSIYPNGLFVIADYDPNWLMFIFPKQKPHIGDDKLYADHYSAPYDKQSKRINFHMTVYTPYPETLTNLQDPCMGTTTPRFYRFKDGTSIPIIGYSGNFMNMLQPREYRNSVIDILRLPFANEQHEEHEQQGGVKQIANYKTSLATKWRSNKIDNVMVVAIKQPNSHQYTITVFINDNLKRLDVESRAAFSFVCHKKPNSSSIKTKIAKHLEYSLEEEPLEVL